MRDICFATCSLRKRVTRKEQKVGMEGSHLVLCGGSILSVVKKMPNSTWQIKRNKWRHRVGYNSFMSRTQEVIDTGKLRIFFSDKGPRS